MIASESEMIARISDQRSRELDHDRLAGRPRRCRRLPLICLRCWGLMSLAGSSTVCLGDAPERSRGDARRASPNGSVSRGRRAVGEAEPGALRLAGRRPGVISSVATLAVALDPRASAGSAALQPLPAGAARQWSAGDRAWRSVGRRVAALAVDRHEPVARLAGSPRPASPARSRRRRCVGRCGPISAEEHEQQHEGDQQVHRRARGDHHDPLPDRLRVVGARRGPRRAGPRPGSCR